MSIKTIYGIHSLALLDINTYKPLSFLKAIGSANLELTGESQKLNGGSSLYTLDSEVSAISSECSFTAREYPIEVMEQMLAGTKTTYASNVAGQIVGKENIKGASGTTLTVALASGKASDLKGGEYVFVFTGTAKGILYALSDIGGGTFNNADTLAVSAELTLSTTPAEVTGYGITLAGPASPAYVSGDSVRFKIIEADKTGELLKVGGLSSSFSEYAALIYAQKRGGNKLSWMLAYRIKAYGMPIQFEEKKFSEWQVKMEVLYDSTRDGVFEFVRQY